MNIETMRLLVAKGLSAEDILEVMETMAEPAKRSAAATRQARYRARRKGQDITESVTGDVTRDGNSDVTTPTLSPSPLPSPHTPQPTPRPHTHPDINTRARKAAHRMPDDWLPAPLTGDAGKAAAAWPPGALERELARFRDWAASTSGPNAKKSDWNAAWRNWIRKRDDEGAYRNGKANRTSNGSGDGRSSLARAIDEGLDWLGGPQAQVS